jgi:hypothetical protein
MWLSYTSSFLRHVGVFRLTIGSADLLEFDAELAALVDLVCGPVELDAGGVLHVAFGEYLYC